MTGSTTEVQPRIFTLELAVLWNDLDSNRHVNNGKFMGYFDEARVQTFIALGLTGELMEAEGIAPVIYEANLKYHKELTYPEDIRVETYLTEFKRSRATIVQKVFRKSDQVLVCSARFGGVFMNSKTRRPALLPDWFRKGAVL